MVFKPTFFGSSRNTSLNFNVISLILILNNQWSQLNSHELTSFRHCFTRPTIAVIHDLSAATCGTSRIILFIVKYKKGELTSGLHRLPQNISRHIVSNNKLKFPCKIYQSRKGEDLISTKWQFTIYDNSSDKPFRQMFDYEATRLCCWLLGYRSVTRWQERYQKSGFRVAFTVSLRNTTGKLLRSFTEKWLLKVLSA